MLTKIMINSILVRLTGPKSRRIDYETERNDTASIFMFVAPPQNWRRVVAREQRTKLEWAEEVEQIVMHDFASAEKSDEIVLDNLQ